MAGLKIGSLYVTLSAHTDAFAKGLESAAKTLDRLSKKVAEVGGKLGAFGAGLSAIGAAAVANASRMNIGVARAVESQKQSWNTLSVELAKALLPVLDGTATVLDRLVGAWQGLSQQTRENIASVASWTGGVLLAAGAVAKLSGVLGPLVSGLVSLGGSLAGIGLGPLVAVAGIVAGLWAMAGVFREAWDTNLWGIQDTFRDVWQGISKGFGATVDWMGAQIETFASRAKGALLTISAGLRGVWERMKGAIAAQAGPAPGGGTEWWQQTTGTVMAGAALAAAAPYEQLWGALDETIRNGAANSKAALGELWDFGKRGAKKNSEDITAAFERAMDRVSKLFSRTGKHSRNQFDASAESAQKLKDAFVGIETALEYDKGHLAERERREQELEEGISSLVGTLRKGAGQVEQLAADARAQLTSSVISKALGPFQSVVSAGIQGAAAGGVGGAIAAAAVELLSQSEQFRDVQTILGAMLRVLADGLGRVFEGALPLLGAVFNVFAEVMSVLGPVFEMIGTVLEPFIPVVQVIAGILSVLGPLFVVFQRAMLLLQAPLTLLMSSGVLRLTFEGLKWLGVGLGYIARALSWTYNVIVDVIADVLDWVGRLEVLGLRPFEFMADAAAAVRDMAVNMGELIGSVDALMGLTWESAMATAQDTATTILHTEATTAAADAVDRFAESLTNVPEGFRIAATRYGAMDVASYSGLGTGRAGLSGAGGTTVVVNGNVYGVDDVAALLAAAQRREAYQTTGLVAAPYYVRGKVP